MTDCFSAYDRFSCPQHKCIAHHLRAIKRDRSKNETQPSAYLDAWEQLWQDVIELRRLRDERPQADFVGRRTALETQLQELLARDVKEPGERAFHIRMHRAREHLLGCLYHGVEATNNRAERAIRPAVIARKVSCGNKTPRGATTWEILASLATTAQQAGRDFLSEVTAAMALSPSMPAG